MEIKGVDKLREKLPKYRTRLKLLPLLGLVALVISFCFMLSFDSAVRLVGGYESLIAIEPLMPVIGVCLCELISFFLVTRMWRNREMWKREHGDLAYQKALPNGISGVFILFGVLLHGFVSVRSLPPIPPLNSLTIIMSRSILPMIGVSEDIDLYLRLILGGVFLLLAMLTARRAILTFGLDYMLVVYLYFPDESEMQEREIYSVVRHPAYFSGVLGAIAFLMFRSSVYSIIFFILLMIYLKAFISVEEGELVERFGESYDNYRKQVPGLYVKPKKIGAFLRYVIGRSE